MSDVTLSADIKVHAARCSMTDHDVIDAARVSTLGESTIHAATSTRQMHGLINFLMRDRHGTPFEHNSITFMVKAPIFVAREFMRHRTGWCLAGDTLIHGATGRTRTLKDLHDRWKLGIPTAKGDKLRQLPSTHHFQLTSMENGEPVRRRASDVWESGVKELVRLELEVGDPRCAGHDDGVRSLRCSRDHRIMTPDGWVTAGELHKGDVVYSLGSVPVPVRGPATVPPALRSGINIWTMGLKPYLIPGSEATCHLCGNVFSYDEIGLDHVVPVSVDLLKALDVNNLKPACRPCHRAKSAIESSTHRVSPKYPWGLRPIKLLHDPIPDGEEMTYDVEVDGPEPNFVANGVVVHNSYNEESGRYRQLKPEFYLPAEDRNLVQVGKPGAYSFEPGTVEQRLATEHSLGVIYRAAYSHYQQLLDQGVAREVARMLLPVGLFTTFYATCNARSLMHFLSLRTIDERATVPTFPQREIEIVADQMEKLWASHMPLTHEAFNAHGRVAP